jgi:ApbE family
MSQPAECATLEAFGSNAQVAAAEAGALEPATAVVERIVAEFDHACSRFRADSELSAVNAAAGAAVRVGPVLLEAVTVALRAARLTGGDVDPTVGQALISLGYDRDFAALSVGEDGIAASTGVRPLASVPGWRTVTVDPERSTIRVAGGVSLDLGATAKALAADGAGATGGLASSCDRRPSGRLRCARPVDLAQLRWARDLEHRGPAVAHGRRDRPSPDRSADRAVCGQHLAHGQRVRELVPGREHRDHRDDRAG